MTIERGLDLHNKTVGRTDPVDEKMISIAEARLKQYENLERPIIHHEEDLTERASRKMKENPMVPLGMIGFFAAAAFGIHNYRNRPKHLSPSLYILRFRVYAQSIAVGSMAAGIAYTILKDKLFHKDEGHANTHNHHGHAKAHFHADHHAPAKENKPKSH